MAQSLPLQKIGLKGNYVDVDAVELAWDAGSSVELAGALRPYILSGTGAPTLTAPAGSLYTNLTGSSTSTRLYVATATPGTWTNVTTAA